MMTVAARQQQPLAPRMQQQPRAMLRSTAIQPAATAAPRTAVPDMRMNLLQLQSQWQSKAQALSIAARRHSVHTAAAVGRLHRGD